MPEYAGIEMACHSFATDQQLFAALQPLIPQYIEFYQKLARYYQIYIQAGTIIEQVTFQQYVNRAYFFAPSGSYGYQDKMQLTAYEKNMQLLQHGQQLKIFETAFAKIGIAICYDSEFPEIVRYFSQNDVTLILVPSYTSTLAGYHRVFLSCRARAIENQCYVALSAVVNSVDLRCRK